MIDLASPRMDALAERYAARFSAAERVKLEALARDDDVSPDELVGVILRSAVVELAAAIAIVAGRHPRDRDAVRGAAIEELDRREAARTAAIAQLDAILADSERHGGPPRLYAVPAREES